MRIKLIVCALVFSCLVCRPVQEKTTVRDAAEAIDFVVAEKYFQEARRICDQDGGKLWGRSLYGPMIFVDRATRTVVANQGDVEGNLTKKGPVFVGRLPADIPAANTAINWGGVHWSMIFWDALAEDQYDRDRLMIHESFHRIQDELGLRASNPTNNHLDSMAGRLWLQLEWRALNRALSRRGLERNEAVKDALIFRLYRRALFPRATAEEAALEMNEGLAEYTGVKLSGRPDKELPAFMAGRLEQVNKRPTFVRSFAYESGPLYGLLLDAATSDWRQHLKPSDDFGVLLQHALALQLPLDLKSEANKRSDKYEGAELRATEMKRENDRVALVTMYRARLVDGPVLILPLTKDVHYSFNPNTLLPLDDLGTIYPTARVSDVWGNLEVNNGALMVREHDTPVRLYVPDPTDVTARPLRGDGWTLQLADGWKLEPGERKHDFQLKRDERVVSPPDKPSLPNVDRIRIAEAFRLAKAVDNKIWKGWSKAPFASCW